MELQSAVKLHKNYIDGTERKAIVVSRTVLLCNLTSAVMKTGLFSSSKVHLKTKVLKHMYDKRTAQEYLFVIRSLNQIVMFPDQIFENAENKRGSFLFRKRVRNEDVICSIEECESEDPEDNGIKVNTVVTAFYVEENYLKKYKLLWSWRKKRS